MVGELDISNLTNYQSLKAITVPNFTPLADLAVCKGFKKFAELSCSKTSCVVLEPPGTTWELGPTQLMNCHY